MESVPQLIWYVGWGLAIALLLVLGLNIAVTPRRESARRWYSLGLFCLTNLVIVSLAQYAILENDHHLDLTRSNVFTPHETAIELIESLQQPVSVTYFGHEDDPNAKRLKIVLENLAKRSPLLSTTVTDLDKDPLLARRHQVKFYNVAVVEAGGRRVLVNTSSEVDIAIAIQKALRHSVTTICFVTGHGELEIDNHEFHTHVESLEGGTHNHHHGHAHIPVVQTTQHGVGRLRRSLETLGFAVAELNLTADNADAECRAIAIINPKFPYLPSEVATIKERFQAGASLIVLLDLGSELPALSDFLEHEGITLKHDVIIDEKQHHEQDVETLAVSSYPSHVITKNIAMTLFPGARSISINRTSSQLKPLVKGSIYSRAQHLPGADNGIEHTHGPEGSHTHTSPHPVETNEDAAEPTIVVVKGAENSSGKLIVGGDADFLSNSYFPYLSNSSLALSIFRWAVDEQNAVRTEPVLPVVQTIVMSQPQMRLLFILLVIVLPAVIVLLGIFVWWKNRC